MEIAVGAFVAAGLGALFFLALEASNLADFGGAPGYRLSARFDNAGGLKVRSPVTLAGVRIGRVTAITIDSETYEAVAELTVEPRYDTLPKDTAASIFTAGLLGEQYVGLEPGGDEEYLRPGDELAITQSALVLEQLIGQFLFDKASQGEAGDGDF